MEASEHVALLKIDIKAYRDLLEDVTGSRMLRPPGVGYGTSQKTGGWLTFYLRGKPQSTRRANCRAERLQLEGKFLRSAGKLQGSRWFHWVPDFI